MHDGPLRVVGEHKIELHLHADVNVEVTVVVESEEETAAQLNLLRLHLGGPGYQCRTCCFRS